MDQAAIGLEAVIGDHEDAGGVAQAGAFDRGQHLAHLPVRQDQRGIAGERTGAVGVMRTVRGERVQQQQVGLVLFQDVGGGADPHVVMDVDGSVAPVADLGLRDHACRDHLAHLGLVRLGLLREGPGDAAGGVDRYPVHFGGSHSGGARGIVNGGRQHQFLLVHPGLDFERLAVAAANHQAVIEDAVLRRTDAGDHGGMVGPGHRGVHRHHAFGGGALARHAPQIGEGQVGIAQKVRRESIETDHDDMTLLGVAHRGGGREQQGKDGEARFHGFNASIGG